MCNAKLQVLLCSVITLEIASLASINISLLSNILIRTPWYPQSTPP